MPICSCGYIQEDKKLAWSCTTADQKDDLEPDLSLSACLDLCCGGAHQPAASPLLGGQVPTHPALSMGNAWLLRPLQAVEKAVTACMSNSLGTSQPHTPAQPLPELAQLDELVSLPCGRTQPRSAQLAVFT